MNKSLIILVAALAAVMSAQGCRKPAAPEKPSSCYTNSGLNPTKAALAVAMADELGRWDPAADLEVVPGADAGIPGAWRAVRVRPGAACLKNGCANTKALLGQQDPRLATVVDPSVFNPSLYNMELLASMDRLKKAPSPHRLTKVGGPVDLGVSACGPHYVFQADHLDGSPLSAEEAAGLSDGLRFYGFAGCRESSNPFIKFTVTKKECPAGRTCVAVDPTDGDNGSGTTTTTGAAPSYTLNRLYDPNNEHLNEQCVTQRGQLGTMISKCATMQSTCGYLYCTPL